MKQILLKALLVLVMIVTAILVLEAGVRVLDIPPRPMDPLPIAMYQLSDNPVIGFEYRPGYTPSPDDPPRFAVKNRFPINSKGFRDHEYETEKPEGTYRIIVLGDSTTVGIGVDDLDKTYPKVLETLLNSDSSGKRYEVMNMGVGGYQTMQALETLRVKGLQYDPDLVLLTFCINDFDLHADGGVNQTLRRANPLALQTMETSPFRRILTFSRLAFIVCHHLKSLEISMSEYDQWYIEHVLQGRSTVRAGFELLSELQQVHQFSAIVLILPELRPPFDMYRLHGIHQRVFQAAEGLPGFEVVDLLEAFAAVDNNARIFSWDGLHMDEYGHATMAGILLPIVQERSGMAF